MDAPWLSSKGQSVMLGLGSSETYLMNLVRELKIPHQWYKGRDFYVGSSQGGIWWTGKVMMIPSDRLPRAEDLSHEIAHWLVAPEKYKGYVNYGLENLFSDDLSASIQKRVLRPIPADRESQEEESLACKITFYLESESGCSRDRVERDMDECGFELEDYDTLVQEGRRWFMDYQLGGGKKEAAVTPEKLNNSLKLLRELKIPHQWYEGLPKRVGNSQGGVWWTGEAMMIPKDHLPGVESLCHEIAHWLVSPEKYKGYVNYALEYLFSDDLPSSVRKRVLGPIPADREPEEEEILACKVTFYLEGLCGWSRSEIEHDMMICNFELEDYDTLMQEGEQWYRQHVGGTGDVA